MACGFEEKNAGSVFEFNAEGFWASGCLRQGGENGFGIGAVGRVA
jgi:hypothetical protein